MYKDTESKYKPLILIVDDSELNRNILSEMLENEYHIIEAKNGAQAVAILQKYRSEISLVLLDIVMPVMDGYDVLKVMNSKHWIDDTPVIIISAENSYSYIERAYELGVTEYISRPFDMLIVRRRVVNTIMLYSKQKKLADMVVEQIYEKENNMNLMISILSHIVEFRNGESGMHVIHVQNYTRILLRHLTEMTDKYELTDTEIALISNASALHDIGKITIPDEILNKPGKLTPEEFEVMKGHSMAGANMLSDLASFSEEPLVKTAYEICRWHHERFDGRGYPDGLEGDNIPISSQVVAVADAYDALTSERVYKKAFTHKTAMKMILGGECGTFNPLIIECLKKAADDILAESKRNIINPKKKTEINAVPSEMLKYNEISQVKQLLCQLEHEQQKSYFYAAFTNDIIFEYVANPSILTLSPHGAEVMGLPEIIVNPFENENFSLLISSSELKRISKKLRASSPQSPVVQEKITVTFGDTEQSINILCRSTWSVGELPHYTGVIGKITDSFDDSLIKAYLSNSKKETIFI